MNFVVKNDHPPVGFTISGGEVTDAEGEVIPTTFEVKVTDEAVLGLTLDEGNKSGQLSFGHSGLASFEVQEKDAAGNIVASHSDGFTVTTGDPTNVAPIATSFEGLTPVDESTTGPVGGGDTGGPVTEGGPATDGGATE